MKNAYIKFQSNEDSLLGFYELVTHSYVTRLSNDIYCIPWESLALLDSRQVEYTFATEEDLTNAQPIWNFAKSKTR